MILLTYFMFLFCIAMIVTCVTAAVRFIYCVLIEGVTGEECLQILAMFFVVLSLITLTKAISII